MYYSLQHHGIKGQKWGVRRYQNKDGTLTDVGRRRLKSGTERRADSDESIISSRKNRLRTAQEVGKKGINKLEAIEKEYKKKIDEAIDEKHDYDLADRLEIERNRRIEKEVYKDFYDAGYTFISKGFYDDGGGYVEKLHYGNRLATSERDQHGTEQWLDEYMIAMGDKKAYRVWD